MHKVKHSVSLRFFSQTADLDDVCSRLGLTPKWLQKIGEPRISPKGLPLGGSYDRSYCSVKLEIHETDDVHQTLERAVLNLIHHKDVLHDVRRGGGRVEFFVGWHSVGNTGDTFDFDLLTKIGVLGIDLALDVYDESAN